MHGCKLSSSVRNCRFSGIKEIVGKGYVENRWRIVNGYVGGTDMTTIGPDSEIGPMVLGELTEVGEEENSA